MVLISSFGQHGGSVASTVASQQEGPGFESRSSRSVQVLSVWSLHVLLVPAWVYSGYSGFPHKDMHRIVWIRMNVGGGRRGRRR